mgnify:CR=1 FL=1
MKVGDLVMRRVFNVSPWKRETAVKQRKTLGIGIVLSKQMAGTPKHPCVTVFYPKTNQAWDIAEGLLEVVSELET